MRVSNNQLLDSSLIAMQQQASDALKYQQQIASGNRFAKASEGPVELARGVAIQFEQKRDELFRSNQNAVQLRMDTGYVQLDTMSSLMFNLKEMASRAAFPGLDRTGIAALHAEAQVALNALQETANAQDASGRRYIETALPPEVEVEPGVMLPTSVYFADLQAQLTAATTFVLRLGELQSPYDSSSTAEDQTNFKTAIEGFDAALNRVLSVRTQTGSISAQVDIARSSMESRGIELEGARARLLETDIAEASTKLVRAQTLLQAAQSIFARLEASNLFQRLI
jgi:flagellar hook-associated protein 3 FlgL